MPLTKIADLLNEPSDLIQRLVQARQLANGYDAFIANSRGDGHARLPGIHASEVSGCERKIVYSLLATPRKDSISKNWRQRFQMGHAIHGMLQRDFHQMAKKSGGLIAFEDEVLIAPAIQQVASQWFINSSCDGVFTFFDEPGGPPVLRIALEIKSEAPDGYDKLKAPKPEHIEQGHIYMKALDVPLIWYLYMNKANQNNTDTSGPFLVTFDPAIWDKLEAKFQRCFDLADKEEIPPREESMICQFCAFSYCCQPPSLSGSNPTRRVISLRK